MFMNRKNKKKIAPSDYVTYGEAGGKPQGAQKTSTPPAHCANDMRKWNRENQK